jgi:purine-binding chemotaxis protein CheW
MDKTSIAVTESAADIPHKMGQLLLFILDEQHYGLPLTVVERVVQAVALTPVPKSPKNILGAMNLHGLIIPVYDTRQCLGLPTRDMILSDKLIVVNASGEKAALLVDRVLDVVNNGESQTGVSPSKHMEHMIRLDNELVFLLHDVAKLPGLNQKEKRVTKHV